MPRLTRDRILAIAGDLSDSAVAEIERLDATEAELLSAVEWLSDDVRAHREVGRPPEGRAAVLLAILATEDDLKEADERR